MERESRPGVLLLAPSDRISRWTVVEVDAELFESVQAGPDASQATVSSGYESVGSALGAAYELLALLNEGRMPGMHEYIQESARDFVATLEHKGFDRQTAIELLMQVIDDLAERSPVAHTPRRSNANPRGIAAAS